MTGVATRVNAAATDEAAAMLRRCCGSTRWVERIVAGRPYADDAALFAAAEREWWALGREDWLHAFAAHPRIGERAPDAWSRSEQAGLDGSAAEIRRRLAAGNVEYERRFGHVYLVCAAGRSGADLLADLESRLTNEAARELRVAATEQAKITRLRLEKLATP